MEPGAAEAYIAAIKRMTPEERLVRAFELYDFAWQMKFEHLRAENRSLSDKEVFSLVRREFLRASS